MFLILLACFVNKMDYCYIWFIFILCLNGLNCENCRTERRCKISRVHGMKAADCYDLEFRDFPQCITSDIEIIDLTKNRIRKLGRSDLKRYSHLKMLYLSDNAISYIDNEAFKDLDGMTTIDLSLNSLQSIPPLIFQLPSLKNIYLGQNLNMNIVDSLEDAKQIRSPLKKMDISYISDEEKRADFPNLGIMPFLSQINMSGNDLNSFKPEVFAGLCNLEFLITDNITVDFDYNCDCHKINKWLTQRNVTFTPFECAAGKNECSLHLDQEDLEVFNKCKALTTELQSAEKMKTGLKYGSIIVGIVLLVIITYLVYRYTNRRNRQARDKPTKLSTTRSLLP